MTVKHYENFPVASIALPAHLRRPVELIYRFAREADDFADEGDAPPGERLAALNAFLAELSRIESGAAPTIPWFVELSEMIRARNLPLACFRDLISAFSQDVTTTRYGSFGEVLDYCRRSANPVGRLLLVLYGANEPRNLVWSDAICTSLQLINFLQDVAVDYRKNRIYLPQDELARYAITEAQIAAGDASGNWRDFMAYQIARTRNLLYSGMPLGRTLKGRIGFEMRMIIQGGDRILAKIADAGGDVFRRRPVLQPVDWVGMTARALVTA